MNINTPKAFTLVEAMVVALLSTIVFAGIYSTLIVGNKSWEYYDSSITAKKEARNALFGMAKELREAKHIKVIQGDGECALHFSVPVTGAVSYVWSEKGDNANKIIRRSRRGTRVLAKHISNVSFNRFKNSIIINLAARREDGDGNTSQVILKEKVALRPMTTLAPQF